MENGESVNLAWNATDTQEEALLKLEYLLFAHHAYLIKMTEDLGELENEVTGFYLTGTALLKELKDSAELIQNGLKKAAITQD